MITYGEAKSIVIAASGGFSLSTERVSISDALGRVCASEVNAPITIQPFDNSAMDGFALKYGGAGVLRKTLEVAAGDPATDIEIKAGECAQIMTGAPVPLGVDTVVPIEQVVIDGDNIKFPADIKQGAHIRKAGEDFQKGQNVLKRGDSINSRHIMVLSTLGVSELEVFKKPRVAFLSTGKELVDDLSKGLRSGQIYNSNSHYARAFLNEIGADCIESMTIPDEPKYFEEKLVELMKQDIDVVISSGAVSAGKYDFVKDGLESIGAEILFHKVKMKPGKPNLLARLQNGTLYFGLPGNPVATTVGLRFFVQPCLRAMQCIEGEQPVKGVAVTSFKKRAGLRMFLKAQAQSSDNGSINVDLLDGQASFMVSPFLNMNCWAVIPEDIEEVKAGDIIDLYPLCTSGGFL